ncbi:MAG: radical SAM protein [Nitrospinae bacterium CG11_big_fil_rev_8_21_14_0_20_45_15]|nr:MAG: radical SAM protein [Nitrospinae bacterium CG11_big_fil_rev_8_21_14_0_20_45_15]
MIIDSHAHIDTEPFDEDREEVIQRARDQGVEYILNVGCDIESSRRSLDLAERYDLVYSTAGVHPHDVKSIDEDTYAHLRVLLAHPKTLAVGETGLDFFKNYSPKEEQLIHFRKQVELARELNKPIIVHTRDAQKDTIAILADYFPKNAPAGSGIFHCFSGDQYLADRALEMGFYISFSGSVTFKKADDLRAVAKTIPAERLFAETDCPYLAPVPNRGKRNEPSFVRHVAQALADLRGVDIADFERASALNFFELFGVGRQAKTGTIAYQIRNSLYLNLTQRCTADCVFCTRLTKPVVQGYNLKLDREPTAQELWEAIDDPKKYDQVVFCGFGEPTLRLDTLKEVAAKIKSAGGQVRLNTNGHGNIINKRNILPELKGLIDEVSVSLNADTSEAYDAVTQPLPGFRNGIYDKVKEFIVEAKKYIPKVQASIVTHQKEVDEEQCHDLAENTLGVQYRMRRYNIVG